MISIIPGTWLTWRFRCCSLHRRQTAEAVTAFRSDGRRNCSRHAALRATVTVFHGYADIVEILLARDPTPPLTFENEFGVIPLRTCVYGSLNGWETGHPRDHARTIKLLLEAGSPLDPTILPTGNDELDAVMRRWLKEKDRHDY